jgi:ATP-dependent Clp protease ATP-binding subunit ClpA
MDRSAQLRSLLSTITDAADPGERLGAVTSLKRELDSVETEIAADALRAGLSWSQIGTALGVSKQAAHRRHSHGVARLDQAAETQHRGRRAIVSSEARRAVRIARREAAEMGERTVGTEHLLLGLMQCGDPPTTEVLHRLGITLLVAREAMQPTVEVSLEVVARARSIQDGSPVTQTTDLGAPPETRKPSAVVSPLARRVLERALRPQEGEAWASLTALDLLEALLRYDHGGAARTLAALGVDAERARSELALARR